MSRSISDLTSPEVAEQIRRNPVAVLPFGSIEQHGPHLPNGTDIIAAEVVAEALADELDALLVPFSPFGVTPIHAGHPGTISLTRPTFEALLTGCDATEVSYWDDGAVSMKVECSKADKGEATEKPAPKVQSREKKAE